MSNIVQNEPLIVIRHADDHYSFNLPGGYWYEINGEKTDLTKEPSFQTFALSSNKPPKINKLTYSSVTSYYLSDDGLSKISTPEYNNTLQLLKIKYQNECWLTLEDEFNYRKFMATWKPVNTTQLTASDPYDIQIVNAIKTDNPFILPIRCIGGDIVSKEGIYKRRECINDAVIKILHKYELKNEKIVGRGDNIAPNKIYTHYDFDKECSVYLKHPEKRFNITYYGEFRGTYDEIKKIYDKDMEKVNEIDQYLSKIGQLVKLTDVTALISLFESKVERNIIGLQVKQADRLRYNNVVDGIKEFKSTLLLLKE